MDYLIRISIDSFVNAILAFVWPALLLEWLRGWGVLVLVVGFVVFARLCAPAIESWFPELREARLQKQRRKTEKQA